MCVCVVECVSPVVFGSVTHRLEGIQKYVGVGHQETAIFIVADDCYNTHTRSKNTNTTHTHMHKHTHTHTRTHTHTHTNTHAHIKFSAKLASAMMSQPSSYGVATISRFLKIIRLFCRI